MKRFGVLFFISFCLAASLHLSAQTNCYTKTRSHGVSLMGKGHYAEAIQIFKSALSCPDKPEDNDLQSKIDNCRTLLRALSKVQRDINVSLEDVVQIETDLDISVQETNAQEELPIEQKQSVEANSKATLALSTKDIFVPFQAKVGSTVIEVFFAFNSDGFCDSVKTDEGVFPMSNDIIVKYNTVSESWTRHDSKNLINLLAGVYDPSYNKLWYSYSLLKFRK